MVLALLCLLHPAQTLYHTSGDVIKWYTEHADRSQDRLRFEELTEAGSTSGIHVATITDHKADRADKKTVLLVFSEHAREIITSEVALWLSQLLVYESSAVSVWPELITALQNGTNTPPDTVAQLLRHWVQDFRQLFRIQIVPLANLAGRQQFEQGKLCLRKTPEGVDLNRNWPLFWQPAAPGDESYGGAKPLSEPQTRLLKRLAEQHKPHCYVNTHSGEWAAYSPWDSRPSKPADLPAGMGSLMAQLGHACSCKAGPAGAVSGYLAFGTSMDYMYQVLKVPYALTVEVFGSNNEGKLGKGQANQDMSMFLAESVEGMGSSKGRRLRGLQEAVGLTAGSGAGGGVGGEQHAAAGGRRQEEDWGSGLRVRARHALDVTAADDEVLRLYQQADRHGKACFEMFNPVTDGEYRDVVGKWVAAFIVMLRHLADNANR